MSGKSGPPARLLELAQSRKFEVHSYAFPTTVEEVGEMIFSDHELAPDAPGPRPRTPSLGAILSGHDPVARIAAQGVKSKMLNQLDALQNATADRGGPKVLMLIGTNPLTASGPGEVLDDVLTHYLNAKNAAEGMGTAPTIDREKVLSMKPDVILLLSPGAPPLKSIDEDDRLASLRGLNVPAVTNGRVALINDKAVLLNSTPLGRVAGAMAKAIYPDLASQVDAALNPTLMLPPATQNNVESPGTQPTDAGR
jgi:hypothetical protein